MFMSDVMISSDKDPEHNFEIDYTASRETDTLILEVPKGKNVLFEATGKVSEDQSLPKEKWSTFKISGGLKTAKLSLDMAFYKEIGAKHKEYLQKMNLEF